MKTNKLFLLFVILLFSLSCKDQNEVPISSSELLLNNTSYNYPFTGKAIATLGRVLFYDKTLSINNSISCGSCHQQSLAFTDGFQFSKGFENKNAARNTQGIQNLGSAFSIITDFEKNESSNVLFWDGRENILTNMVTKPILNHVEMGLGNFEAIVKRVEQKNYYRELFDKTFTNNNGKPNITIPNIASALAAFLVNIESGSSKFDMGKLNSQEQNGINLFMNKYDCNSCHILFQGFYPTTLSQFSDIGLDKTPTDFGRYNSSKLEEDKGKFRIPSLRNVELTAPYMHDGRFKTLDEVIDHYSTGIVNSNNLDGRLMENNGSSAKKFNISVQDKKDIIAFLKTLTDYQMISDPRFSNPFFKK